VFALVRFRADANPRGRSADQRNAHIAAKMKAMLAVHDQATRIRFAATWVVDTSATPFTVGAAVWRESLEYFKPQY
jgi:hypothetical protein